ncbi:NAD(P)/FAD-dependent oxidoreductase [Mycobacterium saskatchewanense]|uniref:Pyridine nucleotide-disulfide oxidoreductase n=1 Tax=Mycobacterium saskatchewanense TaxID=220927 RepID=A0AAJ3TWD6_9MYCO|nr:FAD-dependent oxidoreductase [Mycobacterium saskatchewanense]ORW73743.1 hypothetical protein AWC23_06505 [Mycobacterium saskatchewanense]
MNVVIAGASLAGLRTAEALRSRGYQGSIALVGAEAELPYDRPPLSKDFLGEAHSDQAPLLRSADTLDVLELDLRLETRVESLDAARRVVRLSDGDQLPFDSLVIATGADARTLPVAQGLEGVHVLRTLADARELRAALDRSSHLLVVGGGFIGAEVAAAARLRGIDVDLIEVLPAPMSAVLGATAGNLLGQLHRAEGVRLHCGTTVTAVKGSGRVERVELSDGSAIDVDLMVLGLGVTPATGWLRGSGLDIVDGVKCDARLRAVGWPNIYAAGDVARWDHPLFGESVRVEHWTNANEHADVVAASILGVDKDARSVPYVWSDQYAHRIQIVGRPGCADDVIVRADPGQRRHVVAYQRRARLVGVLTVNAPRVMLKGRKAILSGSSAEELLTGPPA